MAEFCFCFLLIFGHVYSVYTSLSPLCSKGPYGQPIYADCSKAISRLPQDKFVRLFVEQDIRTALPWADWSAFADPRPREYQQTLMQLPKWWSHGKPCVIETDISNRPIH